MADSKLTSENGFVNVDINNLQHRLHDNIFALGDCADLPTSKTLSAINEQFHVVVQNISDHLKGEKPTATYDGYTACPIMVDYNKVMLCEFGYQNRIMPTFFKNQKSPTRLLYFFKMHVFPRLALYNKCGIIQPIRERQSKFPYNKHRDLRIE